jgi:O-antigen/teichoic acid export membrane protein
MPLARGLNVQRLRQLATGGAATIAFNAAMTNLLRIASSMTLTRLLDSHAYGVVGVITSIATMLTMLTDIGLLGFIVRHAEGEDPKFLDQVWTIRLVRGFALMIVMIAIAGPGAALLGKPELGPVVAVWSISFLLEGVSSLGYASAIRTGKLWRVAFLELGTNVTTLVVSVASALVWRSYWALIIGMTAGAIMKAILSYLIFPAARRRIDINRARSLELWRFSRFIAASSMLSLLILQSDKLVLARLMPLSAYGLYAIAVTLAAAPGALTGPYATRVLYPTFSKTARAEPEALGRVFYQARRKVTLLYMFAVGGLLGAAQLIVNILYDPRYHAVAPFLRLIAISAILRITTAAANEVLIAAGKMRATFLANMCRVIWLAIGGGIGLWTGNIMLLVAIVGTVEIPGMLCYWWFLHRAKLLNLREESYGLAAGAAGAGLAFLFSNAILMMFPSL